MCTTIQYTLSSQWLLCSAALLFVQLLGRARARADLIHNTSSNLFIENIECRGRMVINHSTFDYRVINFNTFYRLMALTDKSKFQPSTLTLTQLITITQNITQTITQTTKSLAGIYPINS